MPPELQLQIRQQLKSQLWLQTIFETLIMKKCFLSCGLCLNGYLNSFLGLQGGSDSTLGEDVNGNSVGKKGELSVSRMDFVGLEFADKKKTRGLPPGLVPISDSFSDDDLPEVEFIVGDANRFDDATSTQPEQTNEDESELYKPKVSTWGVFPRPGNISKTVWYLVFAKTSCKMDLHSLLVCDMIFLSN